MRKFTPFLTAKHKTFIMLFDVLCFLAFFLIIYFVRFEIVLPSILMDPAVWGVLLAVLVSFYIFGTYELDNEPSSLSMVGRTLLALLVGFCLLVIFNYIFAQDRIGIFGRGVLLGSLSLFGLFAISYRIAAVQFFNRFRSEFNWLLIIEESAKEYFLSDMQKHSAAGNITVLTEAGGQGQGCWSDLDSFLDRRWSGVICALHADRLGNDVSHKLVQAKLAGHNVVSVSHFYERHWAKIPIFALNSEWFISAENFKLVNDSVSIRLKRFTDLFLSTVLLLLFWPFMALVFLAIKIESAGPAIYRQTRTGKDGRLFTIYKFRSMVRNAESAGAVWAQKNDCRVTRVGKFIRLTRLDELPQLFNVFKGDMSFIGPRPERPEFNVLLEEKIPYYDLRHLVRPGITGWAQVCYPYGASVDDSLEKLQYDIFYIKYYSLALDFIILLRTIRVILFGQGR